MEKTEKKLKLKLKVKIILLVLATMFFLVVTLYVSNKYTLKRVEESVTYNANGSLNFNVCYKENNYVSEECFSDTNRAFVNALVKDVNINFKYMLKLSQNADVFEYTYKITAQTLATEKNRDDRILYSEHETLYEESKTIEQYSFVAINKDIIVDFQKYNKIITEFKKDYILSMDSKLIITASLDIRGNHSHLESEIKNHRESKIIFTLAEQTVAVETENVLFEQGDTVVKYKKVPFFSKDAIIIIITYFSDIILLGMWVYVLLDAKTQAKTFNGRINKLLKQYDRSIVKVENLPSFDDLKEIRVSSFEELLDVRDNLNKPILYKEKNSSALFVIIFEKEVFIYQEGMYSRYEK